MGAPELLIVLGIVVVLFGSSRLPALARSLGQSSKEFKRATADDAGTTDEKEAER